MQDQSDDRLLHLIHALANVTVGNCDKIPRSDIDDFTEAVIVMLNLVFDHHKWSATETPLFTSKEFLKYHSEIRFSLDKELHILKTNQQADRLIKQIDQALLNRPFSKILHKDSLNTWQEIKECLPLDKDQHLHFHLQLRGSSGQTIKAYCSMDRSEFIDGYSLICYLPIVEPVELGKPKPPKMPGLLKVSDRITIVRLKEYIWEFVKGPLPNNDELAETFHTNRSTLVSKFKKVYGRTPQQFHSKIRLDRVQFELRNSPRPVGVIAKEFGFRSLSHFSAAYKERFGCSPKDDRNDD